MAHERMESPQAECYQQLYLSLDHKISPAIPLVACDALMARILAMLVRWQRHGRIPGSGLGFISEPLSTWYHGGGHSAAAL